MPYCKNHVSLNKNVYLFKTDFFTDFLDDRKIIKTFKSETLLSSAKYELDGDGTPVNNKGRL
jgi:hypothetical protein